MAERWIEPRADETCPPGSAGPGEREQAHGADRRCRRSGRSLTIAALRSADEDTGTRAGTFRAALAYYGYRLVLGAYACGAASIGASSIVVSVSLFERTGSPAWAGVGALIRVVPFMLFSGVAGVVIDRTDGRRMLVVAVTAQVACSLALAATASRVRSSRWPPSAS